MVHKHWKHVIVFALVSCALAACGGGGGAGAGGGSPPPPTFAPPTLSLSLLAIKTFRFTWPAVPGITHYKLLEDQTGTSRFAQLGADTAATVVEHSVPLHLRVNARYRVQACTSSRCIDSNEVTANAPLIEAVRYFNAGAVYLY